MGKSFLPKPIAVGIEMIGSSADFIKESVSGGTDLIKDGAKFLRVKSKASIEEEEVIQTTSFLLVKAESIKKLMKTLNISAADAAELLEQEMAKKKK